LQLATTRQQIYNTYINININVSQDEPAPGGPQALQATIMLKCKAMQSDARVLLSLMSSRRSAVMPASIPWWGPVTRIVHCPVPLPHCDSATLCSKVKPGWGAVVKGRKEPTLT